MENFLNSTIRLFRYYRGLAEKALAQVDDSGFFRRPNPQSNSLALIVKHMAGNMRSRFTDFLTTDGEKPWRQRDEEFIEGTETRIDLMNSWDEGWKCLFETLAALKEEELEKIVYIRNEGHTVMEAITRQLAHYPYHVGQMVYIAKMLNGENWQSLSIAKGQSEQYNQNKFSEDKGIRHFTDGNV